MNLKLLNLFILIVLKYHATPITAQSFRGLYVERNNNIWVSGNNGIVLKSSKKTNQWDTISPSALYKTKDFRDIHVFNDSTIIIMSAGDSGVILRTENSGRDWKEVLTDNRKGLFFDVLEIDNATGIGIILGDALKYLNKSGDSISYLVGYFTLDYGKSWTAFNNDIWNKANNQLNALYAASGSSCVLMNTKSITKKNKSIIEFCFAGGGQIGTEIRYVSLELTHKSITKTKLTTSIIPMPEGNGWGIYGLNSINKKSIFAVGGNWKEPSSKHISGFKIDINPKKHKFIAVTEQIHFKGYYSGCTKNDSFLVAAGTQGLSIWDGKTIKFVSIPHLNVCQFSDDYLWYAGSKGVIGKLKISDLSRL